MAYRVFLKAPTAADLKRKNPDSISHWQTVSSAKTQPKESQNVKSSSSQEEAAPDGSESDWILPRATLDAASQRVSEMYKNVIFADEEQELGDWMMCDDKSDLDDTRLTDNILSRSLSQKGSFISWPPTGPKQKRSQVSFAYTQGFSRITTNTQYETQDRSVSVSYAHTSTSSIAAFPIFVINLHSLTSLSALLSAVSASVGSSTSAPVKWSKKIQLLVAVLEVEGPDSVTIKRGFDAGKEVGVLKLVIGDEDGGICKLAAWRELADRWGGIKQENEDNTTTEVVRRGDIIYLENIMASSSTALITSGGDKNAAHSVALTASPNLASRLHVCYRTLPTIPSDRCFRPDLRLAASDPGLRKVAGVVSWLQGTVGLG